jgi:hypothetical protein
MTPAERLYQSLHQANVMFSVMYGLASFFFLIARPNDSLPDAWALGLCLILWVCWLLTSRTLVVRRFIYAGADEAAFIKTQRQLWSLVWLLGLSCMVASWVWSCGLYR